jgi:YVTN family beta-propeller protein
MRQVIAFSLKCINVNPSGSLLFALFFRKGLRCSAVASMVGMVALVFFPFSLSHATPVLYVPNQFSNTVSVIDGSTYSAIKTISVGQEPYGVGVSPDGKTVLIANLAADTVSVIDAATNTVTNTISVGDFPFGVVVSPDGRYAYVANAADDNISVIDTSGYSVVALIAVGDDPHGLVIHPDGSKLYVTNYFGNTVSVINTSTYSVIKTITVGTSPHGIAIHPSGAYVYTANVFSDNLSVISTSSNSVIKTINTGKYPFFPAIDSSGQYLYVSNHGSSSVTVVDISSNSVAGNITVGSGPHGISLDATGSRAYVANEGGNSVSVIDTASRTVITTISVGTTPIAFGNSVAEPKIPSPKGANVFTPHTDTVIPLRDSDPSKAKPIGMGTIAGVGAILSLSVGANAFSTPMDVYLGLSMPAIDPSNMYLFTSAGLKPISAGLSPWKSSVTDISGVVVSDYDALLLPTGTYGFYLRVVSAGTPAANLSVNYYQWSASLSVVRASDVVDKAIALFGSDSAAAVAIFLAIDNGYSLDQIVDAIDAGTLSSLGEIPGMSNTAPRLKALRGAGQVLAAECAYLDLKDDYDRMVCENLIEERLDRIRAAGGRKAEILIYLGDWGYTTDQTWGCLEDARPDTLAIGDTWCEPIGDPTKVAEPDLVNCRTVQGDDGLDIVCERIQPDKLAPNKCTETKAATCPTTGTNHRDPRIISKNPFISFQATSPIPGLRLASPSDNCTPICTDSDGDNYYVQSGCGTGGAVDCNDGDRNINPGRPESCADGIDNNCDGKVDASDPGCTPPDPPDPCTGPDCCKEGEEPCGKGCMPAGNACCGSGNCSPGYECCDTGTGCIPAGYVCCDGLGVCPPGCTCDYQNEGCICS